LLCCLEASLLGWGFVADSVRLGAHLRAYPLDL
jgi:hypothetical protein